MEIEAGLHDLIRRVFFSEPVSTLLENPLDDAADPVLSAIPAKSQACGFEENGSDRHSAFQGVAFM
jgi:hypothetical protein